MRRKTEFINKTKSALCRLHKLLHKLLALTALTALLLRHLAFSKMKWFKNCNNRIYHPTELIFCFFTIIKKVILVNNKNCNIVCKKKHHYTWILFLQATLPQNILTYKRNIPPCEILPKLIILKMPNEPREESFLHQS